MLGPTLDNNILWGFCLLKALPGMHQLHVTQWESWTQHLPQNPAQFSPETEI
jgi:hypothetical protein